MLYILLGIIALLAFFILWFILGLKKKLENGSEGEKVIAILERLKVISEQNSELRHSVDSKLSETHQATQRQIERTMDTVKNITGESAKLIGDVTEKLTKLDETNRQVVNFSSQLQNLQDILKNPKQRGVLGEYFLEETLKNVLPPNSYQMQYKFKNGEIVDAVVFVQKKIIPVDSKFSLENYEKILISTDSEERERLEKLFKQDLKNRIDETSKYIRPDEETLDFAFMFIPSEAVYYDLLVNKVGAVQVSTRSLIEYAFCEKKVIIVSPTSFLAYLQTVLQGLRALQIEESAKEIRSNVEKLGKHLNVYEDYFKKLGGHLGTVVNTYDHASKEFKKIDKDVARITQGEAKFEAVALDKPKED